MLESVHGGVKGRVVDQDGEILPEAAIKVIVETKVKLTLYFLDSNRKRSPCLIIFVSTSKLIVLIVMLKLFRLLA